MQKPLADRFRPQSLDDIVGQKHLLGEGRPLRKIIESGDVPNLIFYGPLYSRYQGDRRGTQYL